MREKFMLNPSIIFLNHGSFGACPVEVFTAYQNWQRELEKNPVEFLGRRSNTLLEKARKNLAAFLHVNPENLVFVTNSTVGVNTVAKSLKLNSGEEVLTTDLEYGACDRVWNLVLQKSGIGYKQQAISIPLKNPEKLVNELFSNVTKRTRLIFFSHITSSTGLILPAEAICARAKKSGIMTFVDGAHAPGQVPLDLEKMGADFYTGNCHKWMCSPKGAGFLYVHPYHQPKMEAAITSWGSCEDSQMTPEIEALTGTSPFTRRHHWQGTRDISAFLSVPAAIKFMAENDWSSLRTQCRKLALEFREKMAFATKMPVISGREAIGQMVAVPIPKCNAEEVRATLFNKFRIEVPITAHGEKQFVRVSVQCYNSKSDLDALFKALSQIFRFL